MKLKKIITIALSIFVLLSLVVVAYNGANEKVLSNNVETQVPNVQSQQEVGTKLTKWIDATYFYTTTRCYTCELMERYIREALDDGFSDQIRNEKVRFQTINVDLPENKHYIEDYKLYTKSFVLSLKKNGKEDKWLNCDQIWKLARNEQGFKKYVKSEVKKYLETL